MKEKDWLACEHPQQMLLTLQKKENSRKGDRPWRLLACAAARDVWAKLSQPCQKAVECAERFADGLANRQELQAADEKIMQRGLSCAGFAAARWAAWAPPRSHGRTQFQAVKLCLEWSIKLAPPGESKRQVALIHDVFGNPFQSATFETEWVTPNVVKLARSAYEKRLLPSGDLDPQRLAALATALEKSGCSEPAILEHLRNGKPHVRGCWVLDLVL